MAPEMYWLMPRRVNGLTEDVRTRGGEKKLTVSSSVLRVVLERDFRKSGANGTNRLVSGQDTLSRAGNLFLLCQNTHCETSVQRWR